jgi:hypothetical protein
LIWRPVLGIQFPFLKLKSVSCSSQRVSSGHLLCPVRI